MNPNEWLKGYPIPSWNSPVSFVSDQEYNDPMTITATALKSLLSVWQATRLTGTSPLLVHCLIAMIAAVLAPVKAVIKQAQRTTNVAP